MAPTTYTPPINTYVPLQTITLSSSASSVTFSNIPTTGYRDLVLIFNGSVDTSDRIVCMQFNGDTGSNYSRVQMLGPVSSGTLTGTMTDFYYQSVANALSHSVIQIFDYAQTDKHKTILSRSGETAERVFANANRWASTNAISSIALFPATTGQSKNGSFNSESTFSLFGIAG